ncbi:MAG TPA: hypothetical protein VM533_15720 [Fimbriiglobus sp.]|jgi:hypothetical protein|nr:hypothetical protein [Fimbriiglobus sp.]
MDTTDAPPAPTLDPAAFDRLRAVLDSAGPLAAIDALCDELRAAGDLPNLFYARLMRKRVELGAPPFPTGPSADMPPETHDAYETAIRDAGREVGGLFLDRGDIPRAWMYFRMLGEPEPIKQALARYNPGPEDDTYPVVEVAWQQGVLPEKGFDVILDRHGVCSAITMVHSADLNQNPALREYCVKRLVRALHDQLVERLRNDLRSRGLDASGDTVPELLRDELLGEDLYHIDVSHLSSVVQMALHLPPGPELDLARGLCAYGAKLSPGLRGDNDPPFDETYADYQVYLDVLAGHNVEAGLAQFRAKTERFAAEGYQFPAEVLVNLLLKVDRLPEALEVARQYLADADERQLSCPGVTELARRTKDYATLAEAAKGKADPVNYLAGLIAGQGGIV